jgi:oligopeptide/dipeptide ABC transporter ATP-binding protein
MTESDPLLSVHHLRTRISSQGIVINAVDDISFDLRAGAGLGIVGESGSGKSITALSILRLTPPSAATRISGSVILEGRDLLLLSERELCRIRGRDISMVFQEPTSSLNPVLTVGKQIREAIVLHQEVETAESKRRSIELLDLVGIPSPERRVDDYPHHLSGGMCQRVMIAMALACGPKLLIADEPTTALDVTIQAQVLDLIKSLRERMGMALILITHNLAIVAEMVEHLAVMYAGRIVEYAPSKEILVVPRHPYTAGLLRSMPRLETQTERLQAIDGVVPTARTMPTGCRFHPRCGFADDVCRAHDPTLSEVSPGHFAACWHPLVNRPVGHSG